MKYISKIILVFFLFLFVDMLDVNAVTINNAGVGISGIESSRCVFSYNSRCGNTVGLQVGGYNFNNTAIYGFRVTIVKKNGESVDGYNPINFWASDDMKKVATDSNYVKKVYDDNLKISNYTFKRLYSWDGGGLRNIDISNRTYAKFINELSFDDVSLILSKFKNNYEELFEKEYVLKIEPIFVLHFTITGRQYYFQGTAREIISHIYSNVKYPSQNGNYNSEVYDYYWMQYIMLLDYSNNHWNVLRNFLLTTYLKSNPSGFDFNTWSNSNPNNKDMYEAIVKGNGKGLSVGYLWIDDFKNYTSSVTITKLTGAPASDNKIRSNQYYGHACFDLLKKNADGTYSVVVFYNRYSSFCTSEVNDEKDLEKQRVRFKNLSPGTYVFREIYIDTESVDTVIFKGKNPGDGSGTGVYSLDMGGGTPTYEDNFVVSKEFKVEEGKNYYFVTYNDKRNIDNSKNKVVVYKEFKNSDNETIKATAKFSLYKKEYIDGKEVYKIIRNTTKAKGVNKISFANLVDGDYRLFENDIDSVKEIREYDDANTVERIIAVNDGPPKYSLITDFSLSGGKTFNVHIINIIDGLTTCDAKLNKLKDTYCNGGICSDKKSEFIFNLWNLYDEFESDDFNKLFNYKIENGNLSIDGVSCNHVDCSPPSSNQENSCDSGIVYPSQAIENNVERRVCYIGNKNSQLTGNFINEDINAYCNVTYDYNNIFTNEEVAAGTLLWRQLGLKVGNLTVKVNCEGVYYKNTHIDSYKLDATKFIDDVLPSFRISWESYIMNLNLEKKDEFNSINPNYIECVNEKEYCFATWSGEYKFNINYPFGWVSSNFNGTLKNEVDKNDNGLPIDYKTLKNSYNATLSVNDDIYDCPYSVDVGPFTPDDPSNFNDKKINLNFRIIDTHNPFPGIDGNSRLVGDNWCLDSRIGMKILNNSGDLSYVGDINGDNKITTSDFQHIFNDIDIEVNPQYDIDGDGVITGAGIVNCDNNFSDYCILLRYTSDKNKEYNCQSNPENNYLVNHFITGAVNSDSTDKPMYSFNMTPNDIKIIRTYNDNIAYNDDSGFICDSLGDHCISDFLTDIVQNNKIGSNTLSSNFISNESRCYTNRIKNVSNVEKKWCNNVVE